MKSGRRKRSKGTWYVSFRSLERGGERSHISRTTENFPNEQEAKSFARAKLAMGRTSTRAPSTLICRNGLLHPHGYLIGSTSRTIDHDGNDLLPLPTYRATLSGATPGAVGCLGPTHQRPSKVSGIPGCRATRRPCAGNQRRTDKTVHW